MEALAGWFPRLHPVRRDELRDRKYVEPGRDLAMLLDLRSYFADEYLDLDAPVPKQARQVKQSVEVTNAAGRRAADTEDIVYENPGKALPRAVMFRDSFATWLIPLLADHFERITFSWQYTFDPVLVEKERPEVVIQELVERTLMSPADAFATF
jgi:hypothetical protein